MLACAMAAEATRVRVAVVGGGLAGLYAAQVLHRHLPYQQPKEQGNGAAAWDGVVVLEASGRLGGRSGVAAVDTWRCCWCLRTRDAGRRRGSERLLCGVWAVFRRVRSVEGLAPFAVEAGAEFVHGAAHSLLRRQLQLAGIHTQEYQWPDRYFFSSHGQQQQQQQQNKEAEDASVPRGRMIDCEEAEQVHQETTTAAPSATTTSNHATSVFTTTTSTPSCAL